MLFSIYNGIILSWCVFLPADLFELQVKNACFESHKFYENLKNTELLTFLYLFRSCRPGFITVSTENYRGMTHIIKKQ